MISIPTKPGAVAVKAAPAPAKNVGPAPNIARVRTVQVVAVPGRLVLMPERGMKAITAEGATVPLNAYYAKALKNGDLAYASEDAEPAATHVAPGFRPVVKPAAALGGTPVAPALAEHDATAKA